MDRVQPRSEPYHGAGGARALSLCRRRQRRRIRHAATSMSGVKNVGTHPFPRAVAFSRHFRPKHGPANRRRITLWIGATETSPSALESRDPCERPLMFMENSRASPTVTDPTRWRPVFAGGWKYKDHIHNQECRSALMVSAGLSAKAKLWSRHVERASAMGSSDHQNPVELRRFENESPPTTLATVITLCLPKTHTCVVTRIIFPPNT